MPEMSIFLGDTQTCAGDMVGGIVGCDLTVGLLEIIKKITTTKIKNNPIPHKIINFFLLMLSI